MVLSGGGAKAAAHVGALKALAEHEITPAHYVGTSMGAVIAACYARGLTYSEVLKRITSISRRDVASFSPGMLLGPLASSLLRAEPLRATIERLISPVQSFDKLETPLTVTTVDVKSGDLVLFGSGGRPHTPLVDALYASTALPLYYPPARIGDRDYADGGLRAVLPLDVAGRFNPDLVFAVDAGPSLNAEPPVKSSPLPPMIRAHSQAVRILMAAQTEEVIERWKNDSVPAVIVRPPRDQEATFMVKDVVRYVEEGYRAAVHSLDQWAARL